jgi:hypothetical protein
MSMAIADEIPGAREGGDGEIDAAALFAIVWDALAEVLGTAATAAIVRRAAGRAATDSTELVDVVIRREKLEYRYTLPHAWSRAARAATPEEPAPIAFCALVAEIGRLLVELTGTVFISRLEQIPELLARGLIWRPEGAN